MAEIQKKPVQIVETVLRDAHQSLVATRMTTEQMLPIIDKMDKVGYRAVECWVVLHLTLRSDSYMKIRGKDFVSLKTDSKTLNFRCSLEGRISLDTIIMQMML